MDSYVGIKVVLAEPMMLVNAEALIGRNIKPGNEDGYLVEYEDGYKSWSPKEAFEKAYHRTEGMPFGHAIQAMKDGHKVARRGWNGKGLWLEIQKPDEHSKMTLPYIYLNYLPTVEYPTGARVPWLASQTDMLCEDWYIVH